VPNGKEDDSLISYHCFSSHKFNFQVETTTAKAASMALQLPAVYRWCVSGTPIQRGLEDLYGLVLFLGIEPYNQHVWWLRALQRPYERYFSENFLILSTLSSFLL
jgi:hypothetical protein